MIDKISKCALIERMIFSAITASALAFTCTPSETNYFFVIIEVLQNFAIIRFSLYYFTTFYLRMITDAIMLEFGISCI